MVAARAGFTPQEIELDASAILQGEPATTPVVVNDRSYTIRVRFPESTRVDLDQIRNTMITSSLTRQDRYPRLAGHFRKTRRARPKSAATTCSATSPSPAVSKA